MRLRLQADPPEVDRYLDHHLATHGWGRPSHTSTAPTGAPAWRSPGHARSRQPDVVRGRAEVAGHTSRVRRFLSSGEVAELAELLEDERLRTGLVDDVIPVGCRCSKPGFRVLSHPHYSGTYITSVGGAVDARAKWDRRGSPLVERHRPRDLSSSRRTRQSAA